MQCAFEGPCFLLDKWMKMAVPINADGSAIVLNCRGVCGGIDSGCQTGNYGESVFHQVFYKAARAGNSFIRMDCAYL